MAENEELKPEESPKSDEQSKKPSTLEEAILSSKLPEGMKTFASAADAICERRSVRKYKEAAMINPLEVALINEIVSNFKPTLGNIHIEISLLPRADFEKHFKVDEFTPNAPFFLIFMAEEDPYAGFEVGRLGQRVALNLCAVGTGTCFLDTPPTKDTSLPLPYALTLAFGEARKSNVRDKAKANRKQYEALVYNEHGLIFKDFSNSQLRTMDAGRYAPSAFNRQLWRFVPERNAIHLWEKKPSFGERKKLSVRDGVEMGIVAENMSLRAAQVGEVENAGAVFKTDDYEINLKGCKYWASVIA